MMDTMIHLGMTNNGEWLSNCCGQLPLGEIDKYNTGMCGACHEGALFKHRLNTD